MPTTRQAPPAANTVPQQTIESHLAALDAQLQQLKAQVRQAQQLATLGTAAATFAHEVSNLFTPFRAFAERALETKDPQLQEKALTVAVRNIQILTAMSNRMLEVSAAKPARREMSSVSAAVEDGLAALCRELSKDSIRTKLEVDEALRVFADPLQLQQVLFNLFLNAREAMVAQHGGTLTVSAARHGDRVVIEVCDTGAGIAPDLLPVVFDALRTSKPAASGKRQRCAGLGLALCRDLVEENSGTISATSTLGTGTTFTISLPADASERA